MSSDAAVIVLVALLFAIGLGLELSLPWVFHSSGIGVHSACLKWSLGLQASSAVVGLVWPETFSRLIGALAAGSLVWSAASYVAYRRAMQRDRQDALRRREIRI